MSPAREGATRYARVVWLWGPVLAYMAAIFFVSGMSSAPLPEQVSDKLAHAAAYAVLGLLSVRAAAGGLPPRITIATGIAAFVIASGYGALDEVHQYFVPGRSADVADWYADTIGAIVALGVCWAWGMMARRSDV